MKTLLTYTILSVSLVSPNKDTIILQNNELGHKIAELWVDKIEKPVIIFTKSLQDPYLLTKQNSK